MGRGCCLMVPGLSLGLPFVYYLAHSVLRGRTKSSWLPSTAGVTRLQPLVSIKVSPNTELRLVPRALWASRALQALQSLQLVSCHLRGQEPRALCLEGLGEFPPLLPGP